MTEAEYILQERIAIKQFDGKMPEQQAEAQAREELADKQGDLDL